MSRQIAKEYPSNFDFNEEKNNKLRQKFLERMDMGEFNEIRDLKSEWIFNQRFIIEKFWDFIANGSPIEYTQDDECWWYCNECQQHWNQKASSKHNDKCFVCCGRTIVPGYNDLFTCCPDLMIEWNYEKNSVDPRKISPKSEEEMWWKCSKCGYEWKSGIAYRSYGHGCPACAGKVVIPGVNDLESKFPDIAAEWDFEKNSGKPCEFSPFSHKKVYWKCPNGHSYDMAISNRTSKQLKQKCPYCSHQRCETGVNDIATKYPDLLLEWDYKENETIGLFPEQIMPGSHKKAHWICKKCGNKWVTSINKRTLRHYGCPICSGQQIVPGINDFASAYPELAKDWDYAKNNTTPDKIAVHSHKKYYWKCSTCQGEWEQSPGHRVREGANKCPYCSNKKLLPGYNDLETKCPDLISEWDFNKNNLLPSEILFCSSKKVHWICPEGHEYKASVRSRAVGHTGCQSCHKGQQDSIFERFIYGVAIELFGTQKIIAHDISLIGRELDIYIPHLHIAIEPGSWFWHKHKIKNDNIKYNLCKEKDVDLIIIYDGVKNDKVEVTYPCMRITEDLGVYNNREQAIDVVRNIFKPYCNFEISSEQLYNIFDDAIAKKIDMRKGE